MIRTKSKDKALEQGPLESLWPNASSKIMDFLITFGDYDYSVSDISKNSGVSFKTGLNEIRKLEEKKFVEHTREIGNARLYQLAKSPEANTIKKLALQIASRRIKVEMDKQYLKV